MGIDANVNTDRALRSAAAGAERVHLRNLASLGVSAALFAVALVAVYVGLQQRRLALPAPHAGIGALLGLVSGAGLLLSLYLSSRRRTPASASGAWSHVSAVAGVLAPVAALYHAGFKFGAIHGSIALAAGILVGLSVIFGRVVFALARDGRASANDLWREAQARQLSRSLNYVRAASIRERLAAFEARVEVGPRGFLATYAEAMSVAGRSRKLARTLRRDLRRVMKIEAEAAKWSPAIRRARTRAALKEVTDRLAAARRIARFRGYQRLFAAWQGWHFLVVLAAIAALIVHAVAVYPHVVRLAAQRVLPIFGF
jgi:hypothetical protein